MPLICVSLVIIVLPFISGVALPLSWCMHIPAAVELADNGSQLHCAYRIADGHHFAWRYLCEISSCSPTRASHSTYSLETLLHTQPYKLSSFCSPPHYQVDQKIFPDYVFSSSPFNPASHICFSSLVLLMFLKLIHEQWILFR